MKILLIEPAKSPISMAGEDVHHVRRREHEHRAGEDRGGHRLEELRDRAWELERYGISYEIISDNAAGHFLHSGVASSVFVGADRVAANGDVGIGTTSPANKLVVGPDGSGLSYAQFANSTTGYNQVDGFRVGTSSSGGAFIAQQGGEEGADLFVVVYNQHAAAVELAERHITQHLPIIHGDSSW